MSDGARIGLSMAVGILVGAVALGGAQDDKAAEAAVVPAKIPEEARLANNPRPATPESVDNGKLIFASQCTMCHGVTGKGDGDLAGRLGYAI
ncbi:MAG TPA: c-type cytochrome, partial [Candidatus Polarisedimenticolaceae bacterium]|nr:c-type cytochrome [Candidatus Polarisedimenticolaceae bacterium]